MDETIYLMLEVLFDFELEVWFSILVDLQSRSDEIVTNKLSTI